MSIFLLEVVSMYMKKCLRVVSFFKPIVHSYVLRLGGDAICQQNAMSWLEISINPSLQSQHGYDEGGGDCGLCLVKKGADINLFEFDFEPKFRDFVIQ